MVKIELTLTPLDLVLSIAMSLKTCVLVFRRVVISKTVLAHLNLRIIRWIVLGMQDGRMPCYPLVLPMTIPFHKCALITIIS